MTPEDWHEDNQRYLSACLAELIERLRSPAGQTSAGAGAADIRQRMQLPPALDVVAASFELSDFEQAILLMCAGVELDSAFAERLRELGGGRAEPSFGLALACLPEAHWSALAPAAPLRRWRLVETAPGALLTAAHLRIDERILHFLTGVHYLDERLAASIEPLREYGIPTESHRALARVIVDTVGKSNGAAPAPVIELLGADPGGKRVVAADVARALGAELCCMPANEIPSSGGELQAMAMLWSREVALAGRALYVDAEERADAGGSTRDSALSRFVDAVPGLVLIASQDRRTMRRRASLGFEIDYPRPREQLALWNELLAGRGDEVAGQLQRVASQSRRRRHGAARPRARAASMGRVSASGAPTTRRSCPAHRALCHVERSGRAGRGRGHAAPGRHSRTPPPRGARALEARRAQRARAGYQRVVRGGERHRQDHGGRGARERAALGSLPHRRLVRGQQIHR
jgi:hypothetical protein